MSRITMYASYSDEEIIQLAEDRFFSNDLVAELAQRFYAGLENEARAEEAEEAAAEFFGRAEALADRVAEMEGGREKWLDDLADANRLAAENSDLRGQLRARELELYHRTAEYERLLLDCLTDNDKSSRSKNTEQTRAALKAHFAVGENNA